MPASGFPASPGMHTAGRGNPRFHGQGFSRERALVESSRAPRPIVAHATRACHPVWTTHGLADDNGFPHNAPTRAPPGFLEVCVNQPPTPPRRPEILAPGGSIEAIEVALAHGADAIYLGVGTLNARTRARNLTEGELPGVVAYVHSFGAKVYAALNVPLQPGQIEDAARTLAACHDAGVDAAIVRDPVLMQVASRRYPDLPLHASTQFGVMDPTSARRARDLGCRRVILAREVSREDVARIRREVPDVEVEVFVFGAQCFAVSGQCLLGQAVSRRSGNYGACSQPCRLPYFADDGREVGHIFSMRDIDLVSHVPELVRMGITALKIEGRLKSPAWVGCVVHWQRRALDKPGDPGLDPGELRAFDREVSVLYSRPRTAAFFEGRTDAASLTTLESPGHRGLDVGAFTTVPGTPEAFVRFRTPVDLNIRDGLLLTVSDPAAEGGVAYVPMGIRELHDEQGRAIFRVSAERVVSVPIRERRPIQAVAIHSCDPIRARYQRVDRRVPGPVAEGIPPTPTFTRVAVRPDAISVAMQRGRRVVEAHHPIVSEPARNAGLDAERAARVFGDARFDILPGLFVNPTLLKEARRTFVAAFEQAREAAIAADAQALLDDLSARSGSFQAPDADLLARGPAAISRVTGLPPIAVRTSGGTRFRIEARGHATVIHAIDPGPRTARDLEPDPAFLDDPDPAEPRPE